MKSSLVGHNEFGILIPKDGPSGDVSWANRYLNYGERRGKSVTETKCVCWGEGEVLLHKYKTECGWYCSERTRKLEE